MGGSSSRLRTTITELERRLEQSKSQHGLCEENMKTKCDEIDTLHKNKKTETIRDIKTNVEELTKLHNDLVHIHDKSLVEMDAEIEKISEETDVMVQEASKSMLQTARNHIDEIATLKKEHEEILMTKDNTIQTLTKTSLEQKNEAFAKASKLHQESLGYSAQVFQLFLKSVLDHEKHMTDFALESTGHKKEDKERNDKL